MQNKAKLFFETSIMGSWPLIPFQKGWSMLKKCVEKCKPESIMYQKKQKMQNEPNLKNDPMNVTKVLTIDYDN